MPLILSGPPGRITAIYDEVAAGSLRLFGMTPDLSFGSVRVLITRVGISKNANFQFQHTLGNIVYVYVFGDRVGAVSISGLAVGGPVAQGRQGCFYESYSGLDGIMAYYEQNKISNTNGSIEVEVMVSRTPVRGFLTGMTLNLINPEFQLAEFNLMINTIPEIQGVNTNQILQSLDNSKTAASLRAAIIASGQF